ncbi:MAG TPA: DUF1015 domain-containing protein [Phycisphaerae bacterium]
MAEISPFAAIRYRFDRAGGDVSALLAPPYDVLDAADKEALLARHRRNIAAIDLPHVPPREAGPRAVYEQAGHTLESWLREGTLVREPVPALYAYQQLFEHGGRRYTRRMFIARVRLVPFSQGSVLPHEETFGGPKEDRLALMRATRCNLSPIFGLFNDPGDTVGQAFAPAVARAPDAFGTLERVENRLWIVTDAATIQTVQNALADRKVYIADGHHRYATALLYRDELTAAAPLAPDHPANFVMFVLVSMDDPGCLILPYHRVLTGAGVSAERLLQTWSAGVARAADGPPDLVLFDPRAGEIELRFTDRARLAKLAPQKSAAWRQLDTAYLHRYLLDEALPAGWSGPLPTVQYVKSADDARDLASAENGVALLLRATPLAQLRAVSEAGDLMPQKSTYFYPKLATGLTINPLS